MKIGIYGGTFNPPHLGHLTAAAAVIATLKLDKLLLIPASIPPHKDLPAGSATAEQRLEMSSWALGARWKRWIWRCAGRERALPPTRWRS